MLLTKICFSKLKNAHQKLPCTKSIGGVKLNDEKS